EIVVPWCRNQKLEVTRARAYQKNDQAFVEQKNGAVVRRLVGYGRFDGVESAKVMARLYAAARLYVNFFQPSFKLKKKWREGAKIIKRSHAPMTPYERVMAHQKLDKAVSSACGHNTARSIRSRCWLRFEPFRKSSVPALVAVDGLPHRRRRGQFRQIQPHLRNGSACRAPKPLSRVLRTAGPSDPTRRVFACPPSSIRTSLRSRAGLLPNRS